MCKNVQGTRGTSDPHVVSAIECKIMSSLAKIYRFHRWGKEKVDNPYSELNDYSSLLCGDQRGIQSQMRTGHLSFLCNRLNSAVQKADIYLKKGVTMQKRYKMVTMWVLIICFLLTSVRAVAVRRFTTTTTSSAHAIHSMMFTNKNNLATISSNLTQYPTVQLTREVKKQNKQDISLHTASILGKNQKYAQTKLPAKPGMTPLTLGGLGKVILISISNQWMYMYQDGIQVANTPITTGRPGLDTPVGTFHVFNKESPTTFYSMWSPGSPNYFAPTHINFALEFLYPGYFIHDSLWRHNYGPGSNDPHYIPGYGTESGSHGCINVPYSVMPWLYSWADVNTAVQLSY